MLFWYLCNEKYLYYAIKNFNFNKNISFNLINLLDISNYWLGFKILLIYDYISINLILPGKLKLIKFFNKAYKL